MKLTVSITTFNHEQFIAEAIESALMQKTDFDFEILIGEDDSEDNTRAIVKEYHERFPGKIRAFYNNRSNVIYINGKPTGRRNFINNLKNAKGEYIALCEGDDYWTDPFKLQKQVDFLDNHPECSMCFHSAARIYEGENIKSTTEIPPKKKKLYKLEDLLERNFIVTCTCMFRKGLFGPFPKWFYKTPMGDWPLHILNAQQGHVGYIDEIMSVYRIHNNSYWFSQGPIKNCLNEISFYNIIAPYYSRRNFRLIQKAISLRYYYLAKLYQEQQKNTSALLSMLKCFSIHPAHPSLSQIHLLGELLRLFFLVILGSCQNRPYLNFFKIKNNHKSTNSK